MKQALGLIVGLVIGAAGAILFSQSMPPPEGSVEEQLELSRRDLRKLERTIREFERTGGSNRSRRTVSDGIRDIARDIREGRDVSLDDIVATMKPWLRDMAPLFERIREINQEDWADAMAGEFSRKYDLTDAEQELLREWFRRKNEEKSQEFTAVVESDSSGFVELVRATQYDWRDAEGIDDVMEGILDGAELEQFREDRLAERAASVEEQANRGLTRVDNIVGLDDDQREAVFAILARGSDDYRPGEMAFDGMGDERDALDRDARNEALRGVLQPEQVVAFDSHLAERKEKAERDLRKIGLTLPRDWDQLEGDQLW